MREIGQGDRWWRWLWITTLLALALLCMPAVIDFYSLRAARKEGDLPKALAAARSLSESFFGPLFSLWLDDVTKQIRREVVETNLLSIKRLVPDSEESAYAEMELGRLALNRGDAPQAAMHFERYLKSGLGRDEARARMDLSEAYKELKKYTESADLLEGILKRIAPPSASRPRGSDEAFSPSGWSLSPGERMEAAFRLGELYQFYLNRPQDAVPIYQRALEDTATPGRWRNDILTNMSLLSE